MKKVNNKQSKLYIKKLLVPFKKIKTKVELFLLRRPHRSFQLTRRRDYVKNFQLPGYFPFTKQVIKKIWKNRRQFSVIILLYAIFTLLMVGMASQDLFSSLKDTINSTGDSFFNGGWGEVEKAGILFFTALTGGLSQELTEAQQIYAGILSIMAWLSCVWLLRSVLAGHKVKARDAIYSAGSPLISTFIVALLFIVQALPIAIALIGYGAATATGLLDGGVEAMMFWIAAGLLAVLSLYWMTSTLISLVVVTLPGMYPRQAIKIGSDLVVGRRLKILLRFLWMLFLAVLTWAMILIPLILLDDWLKDIWLWFGSIPLVPVFILLLSSLSIVWISSYVYLLYRKVVADDASTI